MIKLIPSLVGAVALAMLTAVTGCVAETDGDPGADNSDVDSSGDAVAVTPKQVQFGVAPQWYQNYTPPSSGPANVNIVAVGNWLLKDGFTPAHQQKVEQLRAKKKEPYFFGYIATDTTKKGLGSDTDCNGDTSVPLCKSGAAFIRSHIDSIAATYKSAAQQISKSLAGTEALIHIEPDWYQFSQKSQSKAFTRDESNAFMNKLLGAIKSGCPSCKVVIDFSPWFSPDKTTWATSAGDFYKGWDRSVVKYVGLTGKPFPFTTGKIDNFHFADITKQLGLPLVVVDAYDFGGGPLTIDSSWLNVNNVKNAAAMGVAVVMLSQQGNVSGYDSFISKYRATP